jgi:hypothetical protein
MADRLGRGWLSGRVTMAGLEHGQDRAVNDLAGPRDIETAKWCMSQGRRMRTGFESVNLWALSMRWKMLIQELQQEELAQ